MRDTLRRTCKSATAHVKVPKDSCVPRSVRYKYERPHLQLIEIPTSFLASQILATHQSHHRQSSLQNAVQGSLRTEGLAYTRAVRENFPECDYFCRMWHTWYEQAGHGSLSTIEEERPHSHTVHYQELGRTAALSTDDLLRDRLSRVYCIFSALWTRSPKQADVETAQTDEERKSYTGIAANSEIQNTGSLDADGPSERDRECSRWYESSMLETVSNTTSNEVDAVIDTWAGILPGTWSSVSSDAKRTSRSYTRAVATNDKIVEERCSVCGRCRLAHRFCIMVAAPVSITVLNAYSIRHTSSERLSSIEASLHRMLDTFSLLTNPGGMAFFMAGIAVTSSLGLIWRYRRTAGGTGLNLFAVSVLALLLGFASGLGPLISTLCVFPWTLYIVILCHDAICIEA